MKDSSLCLHKPDLIVPLMAANLTGRHKIAFQVPHDHNVISKDKIPVVLQSGTVRTTEVNRKVHPGRDGLSSPIAIFGTTIYTGKCKGKGRSGAKGS